MIDEILKKYPNDVRLVVKQFPLSFHKQARKASLYALAADRQGKYHEMSNMIFCGSDFWKTPEPRDYDKGCTGYRKLKSNEDLPRQYAEEMGLDMAKFDQDVKDPALGARIDREVNQLKQSSIPRIAAPKFLINGKEPQGKRDIANYSAIIDAELKKQP